MLTSIVEIALDDGVVGRGFQKLFWPLVDSIEANADSFIGSLQL